MKVEVKSICQPLHNDWLAAALAKHLNEGWTVMTQPVVSHYQAPSGCNGHVVGHHPHFMVLLQREVASNPIKVTSPAVKRVVQKKRR